jgi:hypothetical protein
MKLQKKLAFSFGLLLVIITSCSALLAQRNQQEDPPSPSNEYFIQKWVEYNSGPGRFKVKFPKTPREYSELQGGGQSTVYFAEHKGLLLYVTSYGDTPSPIADGKAYLSNISQGWLEMNSARNLHVVKNEEISFNGYQARFLQVETQGGVVRVRWIVVNDRIYYQFVAAPKHQNAMESDNGYEKLAMGFLNSFELTK